MARNPVDDEDDDDGEYEDTNDQGGEPVNGGAQNGNGAQKQPAQKAQRDEQVQTGPAEDDDFELIETDAQGRPLDQTQREASFSEDDQGSDALLDKRAGDGRSDDWNGMNKRQRRKAGREKTRAENAAMRAQLAARDAQIQDLQRRVGAVEPQLLQFSQAQLQNQAAAVDGKLQRAETELTTAEQAVAEAIRNNDEDALLKSLRVRDTAFINRTKVSNEKEQLGRALEAAAKGGDQGGGNGQRQQQADQGQSQGQGQRQQQAAPLDPRAQRLSDQFRGKYRWLNPDSEDDEVAADTKTVMLLDNQVMKAGFDPGTQEYWDELEDRMRRRLPHVFKTNDQRQDNGGRQNGNGNGHQQPAQRQQAAPQRRGPMTGAPGNGGQRGGKTQFYLSPERRDALIAAGALDSQGKPADRTRLKEYVTRYQEFDRANGTAQ